MDITQGDGFEVLCPFLGSLSEACQEPFPNSKHAKANLYNREATNTSRAAPLNNNDNDRVPSPSRRRRLDTPADAELHFSLDCVCRKHRHTAVEENARQSRSFFDEARQSLSRVVDHSSDEVASAAVDVL